MPRDSAASQQIIRDSWPRRRWQAPSLDQKHEGFEDLFDEYFKKSTSRLKKRVFDELVADGRNMIIPETATSFKPVVRCSAVLCAGRSSVLSVVGENASRIS